MDIGDNGRESMQELLWLAQLVSVDRVKHEAACTLIQYDGASKLCMWVYCPAAISHCSRIRSSSRITRRVSLCGISGHSYFPASMARMQDSISYS